MCYTYPTDMARPTLILLFISVALLAQQAQPTRSKYKQSNKATNTNSNQRRAPQSSQSTVIQQQTFNGEVRNKESQGQRSNRSTHPHDWVDWVNAFSTMVIALFTILLFFAVIWQTRTTKSIERAWVLAEIGNLPDIPVKPDTMAILCVMPTFINSGRTVARTKRVALRQHQIPKPGKLPVEPEYKGETNLELILPPGKPIQMVSGNLSITPQEYLKVAQGEVFLHVYGFVDYLDVGNVERQTRFCFIYHAPHGADPTPHGFYTDLNAPQAYTKCT